MSKVGVKGEKMAKLDFILQIILKWYKKNNFIHNIILKPIKNTEISGDTGWYVRNHTKLFCVTYENKQYCAIGITFSERYNVCYNNL